MKLKTQKIEAEIARRAMSYKEAARKAGVTETTLKAARNGAEIRTATAGRIAAALGVSIEEIMKG